jgi:hypothetical protein
MTYPLTAIADHCLSGREAEARQLLVYCSPDFLQALVDGAKLPYTEQRLIEDAIEFIVSGPVFETFKSCVPKGAKHMCLLVRPLDDDRHVARDHVSSSAVMLKTGPSVSKIGSHTLMLGVPGPICCGFQGSRNRSPQYLRCW